MLLSEIYNRIGNFAVSAISNPNVTIIFAHQSSTRPQKPFVTIAISNFHQENLGIYKEIDDLGIQDIALTKRFTVEFQSFSDTLHESEDLLNTIQNKLTTSLTETIFQGNIAYQKTLLGVSALPEAISFENESRSALDIEFSTTQTIKDDIGLIEHIKITNLETNEEYEINK